MRRPLLFVFFAVLIGSTAPAQSLRYRDPVFPNVDVVRDIAFGSAVNRFTGQRETLRLDRYAPRGDSVQRRPAIVVVHGGGFVGGDKGSAQFRTLGTQLAQRGYVAVSVNYRLAPRGTRIDAQVITDAAHDFNASVRMLRRNEQAWGIDTARIGAIGSSAGAITALEAAYAATPGNSGNPGFSSEFHAVVDLWGFLLDPTTMEAGEMPLSIVHGTNDPVVPYSHATDLRDRATQVGVPFELHPMQGFGHAPWNAFFQTEVAGVYAFLFEHLRAAQLVGLIATPGFASPGTLELTTSGVANDAWLLATATGRRDTPLGDLGVLCLDPSSITVLVASGSLPTAPRISRSPFRITVPAGLGGLTLYWQAVHVDGGNPRTLTNCETTGF